MKSTVLKTLLGAVVFSLGLFQPAFSHGDEKHGEIGRAELNALYNAYLDIQKALSRDDLEAARTASRDFLRAPHKFPAALSHNIKSADLVADFRGMNSAKDVKAFRRAFHGLSNRMILLLSEAENAGDMRAHVYHCPMADGNKGANWLQAKEGVENPYFGTSMLKCGSLTKTLHTGSVPAKETKGKSGKGFEAGHEGHH